MYNNTYPSEAVIHSMLQREVKFEGDEVCKNCGQELDTTEGEKTWRESPQLILLCQQCEDTYQATINRDVIVIEQS